MMPANLDTELDGLEAECAEACREHNWFDTAGEPSYRLLDTPRATFRERANLMLLGIHARPTDASPAPQEQALARDVAAMFGDDPDELLRRTPRGYMIPFRTESISRLPDALRKHGLAIGGSLVALIRPRVLVLLGGDRVLFASAVSGLPGLTIDAAEETFGATRRTYRDVTVVDDEAATFAAVLPLHALDDGLRTLRRRLSERHPLEVAS